jgi:hypothetical protein
MNQNKPIEPGGKGPDPLLETANISNYSINERGFVRFFIANLSLFSSPTGGTHE